MRHLFPSLWNWGKIPNVFDNSGVITDQKIIEWVFKQRHGHDVQPIATDQFMDKSKDTYNPAWLGRELIQNFLDANDQHPYSLNGVTIQESNGKAWKKIFSIAGDWPFKDPTGIVSLHSEKSQDRSTAWWNGIGLKQVALRLLRDYGVSRFEVEGEKWKVKYGLAEAENLNSWIDENDGIDEKMKHDWLVGKLEQTRNTWKCTYTIETDNEEVIAALRSLWDLWVWEQNTFLQNPDFTNKKWALKWLTPEEEGRLFINGQVMNFKSQWETAEDYWKWPEWVTLQLNDIDYKMSIDRPPLKPYEMKSYMEDFIESMSVQDCIKQLQNAKHIWEAESDTWGFSDRKWSFVVIEKLVDRLRGDSEYSNNTFTTHFPNDQYLAIERSTTPSQMEELSKQWFILCPQYFADIWMPKASTKLDSLDVASNEKPSKPGDAMEKVAQESWMYVAYQKLQFGNVWEYFQHMKTLGISLTEREDRKGSFRLTLSEVIDKDILFHRLDTQNNSNQRKLYELRWMIAYGLQNNIFTTVFISTGEYVSTFTLDYDSVTSEQLLLTRNNSCHNDGWCFLEFEPEVEVWDKLRAVFLSEQIQSWGDDNDWGTEPIEIVDDTTGDISSNHDDLLQRVTEWWLDIQESSTAGPITDLSYVPVQQPVYDWILTPWWQVILEGYDLQDQEVERLKIFGKNIEYIATAVKMLDKKIPIPEPLEIDKKWVVEQYSDWRQSDDFYGQWLSRPEYLTWRHLLEIILECDQAEIDSIEIDRDTSDEEKAMKIVGWALQNLAKRCNVIEEDHNDFNIILSPSTRQIEKLMILREFVYIASGVLLPNDIFLFQGTWIKWWNIDKKAIGLNEKVLEEDLKEALSVYIHEIAHNYSMWHDLRFIRALQSLFADMTVNLLKLAMQARSWWELSEDNERLLVLLDRWNWVVGDSDFQQDLVRG